MLLTGKGDIRKIKKPDKVLALSAKQAGERATKFLKHRISRRFNKLRKQGVAGTDIPTDLFNHIMHHWLWDAAKDTQTTRKGMYEAMAKFFIAAEAGIPDAKADVGIIIAAPRSLACLAASL